jgi:hypothetical protein
MEQDIKQIELNGLRYRMEELRMILVRHAEVALATLEGMQEKKGTAKHELARAEKIAQEFMLDCRIHHCTVADCERQKAGRVKEKILNTPGWGT